MCDRRAEQACLENVLFHCLRTNLVLHFLGNISFAFFQLTWKEEEGGPRQNGKVPCGLLQEALDGEWEKARASDTALFNGTLSHMQQDNLTN